MFFNEGVNYQTKILYYFLESHLIIYLADLAAENSHETEFFLLKKVILTFCFNNFSDEFSYGGTPEVFDQDLNIVRMEELKHLKLLYKYLFWPLVYERRDEFRQVCKTSFLNIRSDDFEDGIEDRIFLFNLNDFIFIGIILIEDSFNELFR